MEFITLTETWLVAVGGSGQYEKNFVSQLTVKTTKHDFNDSFKRRQNINF